MSKILVIPDIHHRTSIVDKIIDFESGNYETIIFTGDYFDNWNDSPAHTRRTAEWLKKSLSHTNRVHLIGNHDMAYMFPYNHNCSCSGFTGNKNHVFWKVLNRELLRSLKIVHFKDNVCYSHAGICSSYFMDNNGEVTQKNVEKLCAKAMIDAENGFRNDIFGCGMSRGGNQRWGGPLWAHWRRDNDCQENFNCILGHTVIKEPEHIYLPNKKDCKTWCLNLDTNSHHYAIVTNGVPEIKKTPEEFLKIKWELI